MDWEVNMEAIFTVMNTTWAVVKIRADKNSGLYGIWSHDPCDTSEPVSQNPKYFSDVIFTIFFQNNNAFKLDLFKKYTSRLIHAIIWISTYFL